MKFYFQTIIHRCSHIVFSVRTRIILLFLLLCLFNRLVSQPISTPVSLSGTLHLYLVTDYGDKMQEVDRYRETGEDSMIVFVLKTDKKIDMSQCLDKEDVENLVEYCGETLQSEFMLVPD